MALVIVGRKNIVRIASAALIVSLLFTLGGACTTYGTASGDADADTPDPGADTAPPPLATKDAEADTFVPVADAADAADARACASHWLTDFDTRTAIDNPPWRTSSMGSSVSLALEPASGAPGVLLGQTVAKGDLNDFAVIARPFVVVPVGITRVSFDIGRFEGSNETFVVAQIPGLLYGTDGPRNLAIVRLPGNALEIRLDAVQFLRSTIDRSTMTRVRIDLDYRNKIIVAAIGASGDRVTSVSWAESPADRDAATVSATLQLGPFFPFAGPADAPFLKVRYDNARVEHCL